MKMGTRSTIKFYNKLKSGKKTHVCSIYQQYDGDLYGVGKDLKDFIKGGHLGNGITLDWKDKYNRFFNGIGCLAAQFIATFKTRPGGLYMCSEDWGDEEYSYEVIADMTKTPFSITVRCKGKPSYTETILFKEN